QKWQAKLPVELHVQREIVGEALSIRRAHVVLQRVHVRIGIAAVPIHERAELESPRQRQNSPSNDSAGNIGRQNSVNVGPNDRLRERNKYARKVVQVSACPTPDIRSGNLTMVVNREVN